VTFVVIGLVLLYALRTIRSQPQLNTPALTDGPTQARALSPELIPLVTGEESISDMFTRAGCPVCHIIPGIPGANGQVGPRLDLGTTGMWRISDPEYQGQARTVRDHIVESVPEPGRYLVPGYPDRTMPTWYGSKLSALALEKIAGYLGQQAEGGWAC
jgi:hypothetical protein